MIWGYRYFWKHPYIPVGCVHIHIYITYIHAICLTTDQPAGDWRIQRRALPAPWVVVQLNSSSSEATKWPQASETVRRDCDPMGPPPKQIHSPENSIEHFLNLQNWWNLCLDVFSFSKRVYFQVPCEFSALIFWIHPQIQIYTLSFKTKKSGDRKKQVPSLKLT